MREGRPALQGHEALPSGVLRDSPLCGPIHAGSCLNLAWLRQALNILFYFQALPAESDPFAQVDGG